MANYKVWNVRKRHEWLAKPLRKKRMKRRAARRIGLLAVWERNAPKVSPTEDEEAAPQEEAAAAPE